MLQPGKQKEDHSEWVRQELVWRTAAPPKVLVYNLPIAPAECEAVC